MKFDLLLKLVCFIYTHSWTMSHNFATKAKHLTKQNVAETKMISKLIEESKRASVLVMNSSSEVLEDFLQSYDLPITVDVNNLKNNISRIKARKISATLLHFRRYADFERFLKLLIRSDLFLYGGHFVIIYDTYNLLEIEGILSNFWKIYIYNVAVLVADELSSDLVAIFTYMPFNNGSCNNTEPIRINEFNKTSMTWAKNVFFPEKFKQLNRCPIRFGCHDKRPGIIIEKNKSGEPTFAGTAIETFSMIGEILNFTVSFVACDAGIGVIYPNKTVTGVTKLVVDNEVDAMFTSLQAGRTELMSPTRLVYADKLILIVPQPFLIDPITKIFIPFTFASWFSIGIVAVLACSTIIALKFTSKIVHDYVIGSEIEGSVLDVCNIFLGGPMQILPRSSFPRFLLAMLLIFTLIVRSLYQGAVFNIMKRDVHTVELKTLDAFIEQQFTFYIYQPLSVILAGSKFMQRYEVIDNSDVEKFALFTLDPSFRGVVFKHSLGTSYMNSVTRKNFTLRICRESLFRSLHGFYFTKNFYLVSEFDLAIESLETSGLIELIVGKYLNMDQMEVTARHTPSALTYGNIVGFFYLFFYGCAVATASFVGEIIYNCVKH